MSRVFGVDFRDNHVRVASLRAGYRKIEFEGFAEELLSTHESRSEALRACLAKLPAGAADMIVSSVPGVTTFSHRLTLPESARKRLSELLPFELEALLPVDIDELVVDHAVLAHAEKSPGQELVVLACASSIDAVQDSLDVVRGGSDHEPERVGVSSAELGNLAPLAPGFQSSDPVCLIDFGFSTIDICILKSGETAMLRTVSGGVDGFPDSAELSVNALRQTLAAFFAETGAEVRRLFIAGEGTQMSGLSDFLATRLDVDVEVFPTLELIGIAEHDQQRAALFARALGAAMHGVRGKGLDLRRGPLSFERGYQHLKARAPLSMVLLSVVLVSFLFSVWAESRALAAEREALIDSLELVTQSTFGKSTTDPDEAEIELSKARKIRPEDPMPYMDGFGAAVALAEVLPEDLTHDVEEFDFDQGRDSSKSKLKIRGQVESAEDAQKVAQLLNEHRCFEEAKISKITQVVNSEKERYVLEALVSCPEDSTSSKDSKGKKGDDE